MQAVGRYHQQRRRNNPLRKAVGTFSNEIIPGDGMFRAPKFGNRDDQSVQRWAGGARLLLGVAEIVMKILAVEGNWARNMQILGYHVDIGSITIALPGAGLIGDFNLVRRPVFENGKMAADIHSLHVLLGCVSHWLPTGRIWRRLVGPVSGLLGFLTTP